MTNFHRMYDVGLGVLLATLLGSCALAQGSNASGGVLQPDQAVYDVQHYDLRLAVDPGAKAIEGTLRMRARMVDGADEIALDLDQRLRVAAVRVAAQAVAFRHEGGRIAIPLGRTIPAGEEVTVEVDYGGQPREAPRPPWDGGFTWEKTSSGEPWIATSCQGEGADLWWPCKDHPSDKPETMDLHITVPKGLVCASNGTLQDKTTKGKTTTFHWHVANPINNYCVALNIAPYQVIERKYESVTGESVPVYFWALPRNLGKAKRVLPEFLDHLRHLEEVCGPYPFRNEKYGVVETPHLGMEHQTIIAYGNKYRRAEFDYDWLHHHELSHEWWANLVTCRDWKDMWLHEGFGTYMQALYVERKHGAKAYATEMQRNLRSLNNRRAVAPREVQDSKQIYFLSGGGHDNDIYYKGSWVLHTLRWLLGDGVFFEAVRRMAYPDPAMEKVTDGSQVRFADTEDFRAIAEKVSGLDLAWFFEVYLRQPDLPLLQQETTKGHLHLRWQTPGELPFPMPVPVRVSGKILRVEIQNGEAIVDVRGKRHEVDPDGWLLKR